MTELLFRTCLMRCIWLKIRERIVFMICLLVHKCIWVLAPESLKSMIVLSNVRTFKLIENKFSTIYGEKGVFLCRTQIME